MEDKLQLFYNSLSANPNIKGIPDDYDVFRSTLADPEKSELFYNSLSANPKIKGLPGDYDSFVSGLNLNTGGVTPKEEQQQQRQGYFEGLGNKLQAGVLSLGEMVTEIPQFAEGISNAPYMAFSNMMVNRAEKKGEIDKETADVLKKEQLLPKSSFAQGLPRMPGEQTVGEALANSKLNQFFEDKAEELSEAATRYDRTATEYIKDKQFGKALGVVSYGIAESLAPTLAAAFSPYGAAYLGLGVGAQSYDEVKDREDMSEMMKLADAVTSGIFEWVFERFGTREMAQFLKGYYKQAGKKGIEQAIKSQGLQNLFARAYKKFGLWFAPLHEGLSEMLTEFGQNWAAKFSGEDPNRKITDNAIESFLVGTGMGGVFTSTAALAKKLKGQENETDSPGGPIDQGPPGGPIDQGPPGIGELKVPYTEEQATEAINEIGRDLKFGDTPLEEDPNPIISFAETKLGQKVILKKEGGVNGDTFFIAFDLETNEPILVKPRDILERKDVPYQEWVKNELRNYNIVKTQGDKMVAQAEAPVQEGQEITLKDKNFYVSEVTPEGIALNEIDEEGNVTGATVHITPDQYGPVFGIEEQPGEAPIMEEGATGQPVTEDAQTAPQEELQIPLNKQGEIDYDNIQDPQTYAQALTQEFAEGAPTVLDELITEKQDALAKAGKVSNAIERARKVKSLNSEINKLTDVRNILSPTATTTTIASPAVEQAEPIEQPTAQDMARPKEEQPVVEQTTAQTPSTPDETAPVEAEMQKAGEVEKKTSADLTKANAEVDTNPTEAQKEAGNYKKGHLSVQGLDISIENPAMSVRSGTDKAGKKWSVMLNNSYGYFRRTKGKDGDQVDVFLGDNLDSDAVYVIDQVNPETGLFDEHKVMLGFISAQDAKDNYLANYEPGWKGLGSISKMSVDQFKEWLGDGTRTRKPVDGNVPVQKKAEPKTKAEKPSKPVKEVTLKPRKKGFTYGPNSRTGKVLSKTPNSFQEAVLQFFIGGGRIKTQDFLDHTGYKRGSREFRQYIWAIKNDGQRLDTFNEALENSFGIEDQGPMDMINEVIDILRTYPGRRHMMTALEKMQDVETIPDHMLPPEEDPSLEYDDLQGADEETEKLTDDIMDHPEVKEIIKEYSFDGVLDVSKLLDKIDTDPNEFTIFPFALKKSELLKLKERLQDEQRRRTQESQTGTDQHNKDQSQGTRENTTRSDQGNAVRTGPVEGSQKESTGPTGEQINKPEFAGEVLDKKPGGKEYRYKMKARPFDIGTYPKEGFVKAENDPSGGYQILTYNRKLTEKERNHWSFLPLTEVDDIKGKNYEDKDGEFFVDLEWMPNYSGADVSMFDSRNQLVEKPYFMSTNEILKNIESGYWKEKKEAEKLKEEKKGPQNIIIQSPEERHTDAEDNKTAQEQLDRGFKVWKTFFREKGTEKWRKAYILSAPFLTKANALQSAKFQLIADSKNIPIGRENEVMANFEFRAEEVTKQEVQSSLSPIQQKQIDKINKEYSEQIAKKESAIVQAEKDMREALLKADDRNGLFGDTNPVEKDEIIKRDEQGFSYDEAARARVRKPFEEKMAELRKEIEELKLEQKGKIESVIKQQDLFSDTPAEPAESKPIDKESLPKHEDFGQKIGGARKDMEITRKVRDTDSLPAWRRKYHYANADGTLNLGVPVDTSKPFIVQWAKDIDSWAGKRTVYRPVTTIDTRETKVFNSEEEAEAYIPIYEVWKQNFRVRKSGDNYVITKTSSTNKVIEYATFSTEEEANTYMYSTEGATSLLNHKREDFSIPALDKVERTGKDWRKGKDISTEEFMNTFGFRGGEFGNWVKPEERRVMLNAAYDSFMDLAELLGVPPRSLSLSGELSIAFGARGVKGAAAHFEPDRAVINLTRMKGAGSLAHEWAHALDNYFGLQAAKKDYSRNDKGEVIAGKVMRTTAGLLSVSGMRKELSEIFNKLIEATQEKSVTRKMSIEEKQKYFDKFQKSVQREADDLIKKFTNGVRRYQYNRKTKQREDVVIKATPDQIKKAKNIVDKIIAGEGTKPTWERIPGSKGMGKYSYISPETLALEELHKAVFGKTGLDRDGNGFYNLGYYGDRMYRAKETLDKALAGESETLNVPTDFLKTSREFDKSRANPYWSTKIEMFARAFEYFIESKLLDQNVRADYLQYDKAPVYDAVYGKNPYPQGEERAELNRLFEKFFKEVRVKTDENNASLLYDKAEKYIKKNKVYSQARPKTDFPEEVSFVSEGSLGNIPGQLNLFGEEVYSPTPPDDNVTYVERLLSDKGQIEFIGDKITGPSEIRSSADIAFLFKNLESAASENVFFVFIDKNNKYKVLYMSTGTTNMSPVDTKIVVAAAKEFKAERAVFVHNHPSGSLKASDSDIKTYSRTRDLLEKIGVTLDPSVIINLDSGEYAVFDTSSFSVVPSDKMYYDLYETVTPQSIYQFDRQKLYAPLSDHHAIRESSDVAEYLSRMKRGTTPKIHAIILDRNLKITRYALYDETITREKLIEELLYEVGKHGENIILASNSDPAPELLSSISNAMKLANGQLLDYVVIKQSDDITRNYNSYADLGYLSEPDIEYGEGPDAKFRISDDLYFSPVERALDAIKQDKATVEQFKAMLLKNGAKQAELDWMGWDEFANDKRVITKAKIQDWIDQNKIRVEEVQKGGFQWKGNDLIVGGKVVANLIHNEDGTWSYQSDFSEGEEAWETKLDAQKEAEEAIIGDAYSPNATKYSQYTLPGGENYKELLLTMPEKKSIPSYEEWVRIITANDIFGSSLSLFEEGEGALQENADISKERYEKEAYPMREKSPFKSSHFDEPNILAHIRFNERTSTDGRRVLFIEEIQSDWAQEGKKKGYKSAKDKLFKDLAAKGIFQDTKSTIETSFIDKEGNQIYHPNSNVPQKASPEQDAAIDEFYKEYQNISNASIPDMPYKKTDQWVGLALRRMVRYAIDNGFDAIAWTPGEVQNERYDLSKQVDEVFWDKDGDLFVAQKNEDTYTIVASKVAPEKLEDYIGKDAAQNLINADKDTNGARKIQGEQLKVGGSGMTGFYDNILPSIANKLGKKFGSQVTSENIATGEIPVSPEEASISNQSKDTYTSVHSLPITDAMFESYRQGIPLFRRNQYQGQSLLFDVVGINTSQNLEKEIRDKVKDLEESLNTKITIIQNRGQLPERIQRQAIRQGIATNKRITGVYDPQTESVYVLLDDVKAVGIIKGIEEVIKTVLHEVVAHKGLPSLLGQDEYNRLLDSVYWDMPQIDRSFLMEQYNTTDPHTIAEEYLAMMAEQNVSPTLFQRILAKIRQLFRKLFKINYSENDIHDMLRRSRENLHKPQANNYTNAEEYLEAIDTYEKARFRVAKAYSKNIVDKAAEAYKEKEVKRSIKETKQGIREYIQDMNLPIRKFEEEVLKRGGKQDDQSKPYRDTSLSFGRQEKLYNDFFDQKMKPVLNTVAKMKKTGIPGENILPYIIAKHAIERNRVFRTKERDEYIASNPEATPSEIKEIEEVLKDKDYSGVMPFDKEGEYTNPDELAQDIVNEFETQLNNKGLIDELWENLRTANTSILDTWVKGDQISEEQREEYLNNFKYFVPLRGWRQGAAKELIYTKGQGFSRSLRHAEGRKTLADNPLAYILSVQFQAISEQVTNEVNNSMLNLIIKNLGNNEIHELATLKKLYYLKVNLPDGSYEWEPTLTRPTAEQFASGEARTKIFREHEKLRAPSQAREHEVIVRKPGGDMVMIFKGQNLPVAQSLNKQNYLYRSIFGNVHDARDINKAMTLLGDINNVLKAAYTSWNVVFPFTNFMRDFQEASITQAIKQGSGLKVIRNYKHAFPAIIRHLTGKTDLNNRIDKELEEFYQYGGATGYTHLKTPEEIEKDIRKEVKRMVRAGSLRGDMANTAVKFLGGVEAWNMIFEDATRFSVYLASIASGNTKKDAAYDAKEASVNFNRKGKGSKAWDAYFAFFNVAIQSMQKNFALAKDHTGKFAAVAGSFIAVGFLEAMMNALFDDDDDTSYYNINPYMRQNYLVIPNIISLLRGETKGDKYLSIPLPQFWRGFKSMGAIGFDIAVKKATVKDGIMQALGNFGASLLPVDIGGFWASGEFSFAPIMPTVIKPVVEVLENTNYMGYAIKNEPFTRDQEAILANAGLGKKNVSPAAKFITDMLFRWGGGDSKYKYYYDSNKGISKKVPGMLDINPSTIEHLFKGYTGGTGGVFSDMITTISQALDPEQEIDYRNMPFINRFIRKIPESKWDIISKYYNLRDDNKVINALSSNYFKEGQYEKALEIAGDEYMAKYVAIFKHYESALNDAKKAVDFDDVEGNYVGIELMRQCVNDINDLKEEYGR